MTENAAPKPCFTHWRVLAAAAVLVGILAVAGFGFGVFDGGSWKGVTVTFLKFHESDDGRSHFAVVQVTNRTARAVHMMRLGDTSQTFGAWRSRGGTNHNLRFAPGASLPIRLQRVEAQSHGEFQIFLPPDGQRGQLVTIYHQKVQRADGLLQTLSDLGQSVGLLQPGTVWVACDGEIEFPRRLPDGTVAPPRLLSTPPGKP